MAATLPPRRHLRLVEPDERGVRPVTRGDCAGVARPCPWVECRHNLADVGRRKRKLPITDPALSCALDVADRDGVSLEVVGYSMGMTREAARLIIEGALDRLGLRLGEPRGSARSASITEEPPVEREAAVSPADEEDEDDAFVSFFTAAHSDDIDEQERADRRVQASIWRSFARWQNSRGHPCRSKASLSASARVERDGRSRKFNAPPPKEKP